MYALIRLILVGALALVAVAAVVFVVKLVFAVAVLAFVALAALYGFHFVRAFVRRLRSGDPISEHARGTQERSATPLVTLRR